MWKFNLSKKTYLIIILSVGFFVGISFSSAYAGLEDLICDKCVDNSDMAKNAITSKNIKNSQVKTKDIRDGTITSADLAPGVGVPIGTVLDWWCSADCTIPDGFVIADGQLISDASSPFNGENVPDLTDTFIRGVTNVGSVGNIGGVSSHTHSMQGHAHLVNGVGPHTHAVNPSAANTGFTNPQHNHAWAILNTLEQWRTWEVNGLTQQTIVDWTNGMDTDGSGHFPISVSCANDNCVTENFYTQDASINHNHSYDVPNTSTTFGGEHNHGTTGSAPGNAGISGNLPPYFGLVQIIRIK